MYTMKTPRNTHKWIIGLALISQAVVPNLSAQDVLPQPPAPFKGKIGRTVKDSTPDFPKGVEAPKGAPNVLLILTDDVGFGASSTFGGPIATPNFQRLATAASVTTPFTPRHSVRRPAPH